MDLGQVFATEIITENWWPLRERGLGHTSGTGPPSARFLRAGQPRPREESCSAQAALGGDSGTRGGGKSLETAAKEEVLEAPVHFL